MLPLTYELFPGLPVQYHIPSDNYCYMVRQPVRYYYQSLEATGQAVTIM